MRTKTRGIVLLFMSATWLVMYMKLEGLACIYLAIICFIGSIMSFVQSRREGEK
jgi:putative flippase GtrA